MNPDMFHPINGIRMVANPMLTITRSFDRRVRGGYLNRWLVRERGVETLPDPSVYIMGNQLVAHPATMQHLVQAIR